MAEFDSGDGRWSIKPTELPTLNFHQFEPHVKFSAAHEYSNFGRNTHAVEMYSHAPDSPKNRGLGTLEWHARTGEILNVGVRRSARRLGVANTLFQEAHKAAREQGLVAPVHSNDRSDEGEIWAKQAGGEVPPRKKYM